jgi:hypothetical protein
MRTSSPFRSSARTASLVAVLLPLLIASVPIGADVQHAGIDVSKTRLRGLRLGSFAVGVDVHAGVDRQRRIDAGQSGTRLGIAIWYPALPGDGAAAPMTSRDYRRLVHSAPLADAEQEALDAEDLHALRGWRHVGIVEMTREQASASLSAPGIGIRGLRPAAGRFPLVMVLGGPYYLSTTAELLATHGFVVAAPFRYVDQPDDVGSSGFPIHVDSSVRDAEWALEAMRDDPRVDAGLVSALGHGGGGMQAMLLAMRSRAIGAVANIDAGNFSTRSRGPDIPFYSPRRLRVPYLYVATAETMRGQDRFADFEAMRFSDRFEVRLDDPALRHHDLSDLGRAVTAPVGIRGGEQAQVQAAYIAVHEMLVRFVVAFGRQPSRDREAFAAWLDRGQASGGYALTRHPGVAPAPSTERVVATLGRTSVAMLRDARGRDPEGDVFQVSSLARLVVRAVASRDLEIARAVVEFAATVHPTSAVIEELRSRVLEARGEQAEALASATRCASLDAAQGWRALAAMADCRERASRLASGAR